MLSFICTVVAFAAALPSTLAQTYTTCNPLNVTCPSNTALGKAVFYDFTQGLSSDFSLSTGAFPTFHASGAQFTIAKHLDSPQ